MISPETGGILLPRGRRPVEDAIIGMRMVTGNPRRNQEGTFTRLRGSLRVAVAVRKLQSPGMERSISGGPASAVISVSASCAEGALTAVLAGMGLPSRSIVKRR